MILELLAGGRHRLSEIAERLRLPSSSVHGLLGTLVYRGFAEFEPSSKTYRLGLKAWTVGQGYAGHRDIVGLATPLMEHLAHHRRGAGVAGEPFSAFLMMHLQASEVVPMFTPLLLDEPVPRPYAR